MSLYDNLPPPSTILLSNAPQDSTPTPAPASTLVKIQADSSVADASQPVVSQPSDKATPSTPAVKQSSSTQKASSSSRHTTPALVPPLIRSKRLPPPKAAAISHAQLSAIQASVLSNVSSFDQTPAPDSVSVPTQPTMSGPPIQKMSKSQRRIQERNDEHTFMLAEYNPLIPNDYYDMKQYIKRLPSIRKFEKEQQALQKQKEEEKKRLWQMHQDLYEHDYQEQSRRSSSLGHEPENEYIPPPAVEINLEETGDEVFLRRQRMAQMPIAPQNPPIDCTMPEKADDTFPIHSPSMMNNENPEWTCKYEDLIDPKLDGLPMDMVKFFDLVEPDLAQILLQI